MSGFMRSPYVVIKWKLGFFFSTYSNSNFNHNKCGGERIKAQEVYPLRYLAKWNHHPNEMKGEKEEEREDESTLS
jgi:hypothetical protein